MDSFTRRPIFRFNARRCAFALSLIALAVALLLALALTASPFGPAKGDLDASASTNYAYTNLFTPAVSASLPFMVGHHVEIVRFGGTTEPVFNGQLTADQLAVLRTKVLNTNTFRSEVKGSPITLQALASVKSLAATKKLALYLLGSDGNEQEIALESLAITPGVAHGVTAIVFGMDNNARVVEALRLAGCRVIVCQTPAEVATAVRAEVSGLSPLARTARKGAFLLLIAGVLLLPFALVGLNEKASADASSTEGTAGESDDSLVQGGRLHSHPSPLPPLTGRISAVLMGDRPVTVVRRMPCDGTGTLTIGRPGMNADLTVPFDVLGEAAEMAITVSPVSLKRVRVRNIGQVRVRAGMTDIPPAAAAEVPAMDILRLGPSAKVSLSIAPVVLEEVA